MNGAVRSKLILTVMQRAVRQLCTGYEMEGGQDVPILFFADDASMISDSICS